jgi:hypothetical protein
MGGILPDRAECKKSGNPLSRAFDPSGRHDRLEDGA